MWHKATSPPHTNGSIVFARLCQCAPHLVHPNLHLHHTGAALNCFQWEDLMWHSTASATGQSKHLSATCREIATSDPLEMVLGSIRENHNVIPLKSAPFPWGVWTRNPASSCVIGSSLSQPKSTSQKVDRINSAVFAGFAVVRQMKQKTTLFCLWCSLIITHNRFMALFPPGLASARRELLDFMVQRKINRGRHIDRPAGRHSIRTNHCPPRGKRAIKRLW